MSSLSFQLGSTLYTIPPLGYIVPNVLDAKCVVQISHISENNDLVILGDTFMRNFYTTFNFREETIGMAVNASANYAGIEIGGKLSFSVVLVICTLVLIAILTTLYCAIKHFKKRIT